MGKSGNKSLKGALQSHQSRVKVNQKVTQAAHIAEQKAKTSKNGQQPRGNKPSKGKGKATTPRRPTIPFKSTDTILLIGEGNFSFARSLIHPEATTLLLPLPPNKITATAYDTEEECYTKYPEAQDIVTGLKERGVEILFGIDATKLEKVGALKGRRWDKVVWNFPHAGKGITDQDRNILSNQLLILGFLRSSANFLSEGPVPVFSAPRKVKRKENDDDEDEDMEETGGNVTEDEEYMIAASETVVQTRGTILITLRNVVPYTLWNVPKLAKSPPPPSTSAAKPNPRYTLLRSFEFQRSTWTGYEHRMTKGERGAKGGGMGTTGEGGEDRTWEFCLRDEDDEDGLDAETRGGLKGKGSGKGVWHPGKVQKLGNGKRGLP